MGKRVLITSGVLHPCPMLRSWYFFITCLLASFPREKVTTDNHSGPLQRWLCFLPRTTVSLVRETETAVILIYCLYQFLWEWGPAILVVSLGLMTPFITPVTFSKGV